MCYIEQIITHPGGGGVIQEKKRKETRRMREGGNEWIPVDRQLFRIQYVRMATTFDWLLSSRANEGAWSKPAERSSKSDAD